MLLAYLDESYQRGKGYWLGVCAVPDENVAEMCLAMRSAAASIPESFGVPADVEMHAQHLYHGQGALRPLKGPVKLRVRIFEKGLEAVRASQARIFLVGVEWNDSLVEHALATHRLAALRRLLGHLECYCEEHDVRALIIADEEETSAADVVTVTRLHQATHEGPRVTWPLRLGETRLVTCSRAPSVATYARRVTRLLSARRRPSRSAWHRLRRVHRSRGPRRRSG